MQRECSDLALMLVMEWGKKDCWLDRNMPDKSVAAMESVAATQRMAYDVGEGGHGHRQRRRRSGGGDQHDSKASSSSRATETQQTEENDGASDGGEWSGRV